MIQLVLLRHGESQWNKENRFTGWADVDLTDNGREAAVEAGRQLLHNDFKFDLAFTSLLQRARQTLTIALNEMNLNHIPIYKSWLLNERHYGILQGMEKKEVVKKFGLEQAVQWRRSYDYAPPAVSEDSEFNPANNPMYESIPNELLPRTESLQDTVKRFLPYWHEMITPHLLLGKRIILTAHGNILRAIVKYFDNLSEEDVLNLNIPFGIPLVYELDEELIAKKSYYLGDAEKVKKAMEYVANQMR